MTRTLTLPANAQQTHSWSGNCEAASAINYGYIYKTDWFVFDPYVFAVSTDNMTFCSYR